MVRVLPQCWIKISGSYVPCSTMREELLAYTPTLLLSTIYTRSVSQDPALHTEQRPRYYHITQLLFIDLREQALKNESKSAQF